MKLLIEGKNGLPNLVFIRLDLLPRLKPRDSWAQTATASEAGLTSPNPRAEAPALKILIAA